MSYTNKSKDRVSVKDYGAKGDGVANDSASIQAAIDFVTSIGGGNVFLPTGIYKCINLVLKTGVYLVGQDGFGYLAGTPVNQTRLVCAGTGVMIDTPSTLVSNCGVIGINISGLGAGTAVKGIRFQNVTAGFIKQVHVFNVSDEAILQVAGIACVFEDILVFGAVLNRARGAVTGSVDIGGTDHFFDRIECGISGQTEGTVQSSNLYCVGFVLRGTNCFVNSVIGELSDIGIYVNGSLNRFSNCRADTNFGHGYQLASGGGNQYTNCTAYNNGKATNNTYSEWQNLSGHVNSIFSNCLAESASANLCKYGFEDLGNTATLKNFYSNCLGLGAVTQPYWNLTSAPSAFMFASAEAKTLTTNSTTPDVSGYEIFRTLNTVPTTITNFTGGYIGQELLIFCTDNNTTIQHNGGSIITSNTGDVKLRNGSTYRFQKWGAWQLISEEPLMMSNVAIFGDVNVTLQSRLSAPTSRFTAPLTTNRTVTLNTTGAIAGSKFRIVRDALATGASALNVGSGPLKALAVGQWCDVEYDGSSWFISAFGSL
jgi:hypothetical protein